MANPGIGYATEHYTIKLDIPSDATEDDVNAYLQKVVPNTWTAAERHNMRVKGTGSRRVAIVPCSTSADAQAIVDIVKLRSTALSTQGSTVYPRAQLCGAKAHPKSSAMSAWAPSVPLQNTGPSYISDPPSTEVVPGGKRKKSDKSDTEEKTKEKGGKKKKPKIRGKGAKREKPSGLLEYCPSDSN